MHDPKTRYTIWAAVLAGLVSPAAAGYYLALRMRFNYPAIGFPLSFYQYDLAIVLILALLVPFALRWPILGGIAYLIVWPAYSLYVALDIGMGANGSLLLQSGAPLVAGVLFLVSGLHRRSQRKQAASDSLPAG